MRLPPARDSIAALHRSFFSFRRGLKSTLAVAKVLDTRQGSARERKSGDPRRGAAETEFSACSIDAGKHSPDTSVQRSDTPYFRRGFRAELSHNERLLFHFPVYLIDFSGRPSYQPYSLQPKTSTYSPSGSSIIWVVVSFDSGAPLPPISIGVVQLPCSINFLEGHRASPTESH